MAAIIRHGFGRIARFVALAMAFASIGAPFGAPAVASETAWVTGASSRLRLADAGAAPDGSRLAAIEIEMEAGYRTYWRDPGESGVPPVFEWKNSANLAAAEVLFPAPRRFEEASGYSIGYQDRVTLPVRVTAADGHKPVTLALGIDYAVCEKICIPVHADVSLVLPAQAPPMRARFAKAWAALPVPTSLAGPGALAIEAVALDGPDTVLIRARAPAGTSPLTLFVEGPPGWSFGKPKRKEPPAQPGRAEAGQTRVFVAPIVARGRGAPPLPVVMTLVGGTSAIETRAILDAAAPTP